MGAGSRKKIRTVKNVWKYFAYFGRSLHCSDWNEKFAWLVISQNNLIYKVSWWYFQGVTILQGPKFPFPIDLTVADSYWLYPIHHHHHHQRISSLLIQSVRTLQRLHSPAAPACSECMQLELFWTLRHVHHLYSYCDNYIGYPLKQEFRINFVH